MLTRHLFYIYEMDQKTSRFWKHYRLLNRDELREPFVIFASGVVSKVGCVGFYFCFFA